ncbi:MAG: fibronectin type III domain-containing protein [bacterium]|nr:fibronectin type III domain-containing protein [bacterium]
MKAMRFRWGLWVMAAALLAAVPTAAHGANAVAEPFTTAPDPAWWTLSGDAAWDASSQSIFLTHAVNDQTGSIFWPWKFQTHWFDASFDFWIGAGTGGEGLTFAWVKEKNFLGEGGSSLGVGGLDGYALRFDTLSGGEGEPGNYVAFSRVTPEGIQDLIVNPNVPEMQHVVNGAGNPAPFHVELWLQANRLNVWLGNPTAETPVPQTVVFDFEIPDYEAADSYFGFTAATNSGAHNIHAIDNVVIHEMEMVPTYRFLSRDLVTLSAAAGEGAIAYTWRQVAGQPSVTLDYTNPPLGVSHFIAPKMQIGTILTFELTVEFPDRQETDVVNIEIEAAGPPPGLEWVRVLPIHLGFTVMWAPVPGAEMYELTIEPAWGWDIQVYDMQYTFRNLEEGKWYTVTITAVNGFGESPPSSMIGVIVMRNLALPAASGGNTPPLPPAQGMTYKVSHFDIARMNNADWDDSNDSFDGFFKEEDFWGYLWEEPLSFDHIAYYTGNQFWDGGWFTSLTVEYTKDGVNWIEAPNVTIWPDYDFTDKRLSERCFSRYDISFSPVRGKGMRIFGTPGGASTFTSISELEVYGIQTYGRFELYGLDAEAAERTTALLDGSHSFSKRGEVTGFRWEQLGGRPVTILDGNSAVARFGAPAVDADTECVFSLTANDGLVEESDEVTIIIRNLTTTADAGPDQEIVEGNEVSLDGSASVTTPGSLTYLWTQSGGETVMLKDADKPVCTFTVPTIWAYTEELRFQLQVDDGLGQPDSVSTDEVVVTVRNSLAWPAYPLGSDSPGTGYLQDLLHLGNNPTDRILAPLNINNDPLADFGGQASQRPYPGLEYDFADTALTVTRNPMRWAPVHSDDGFFGNEPLDNFEQIYHVYILSPTQRDARLHFRHDDGVRLWNNGVSIVTRDGSDGGAERQQDFVLNKGLNSITAKFEEGDGPNYFAMGITDAGDQPFTDLYYSLGPSVFLTDAYAVRRLHEEHSYQWGDTLEVDLVLKINPDSVPQSVIIAENIPPGIPPANVNAPGATLAGGKIVWNLSGQNVRTQTLSYAITLPLDFLPPLVFEGTVSFDGTTVDIWGDTAFGIGPAPPQDVTARTLGAGAFLITWTPSASEGVVGYNVYVRVNAGDWQQVAHVTDTSYTYTDKWFAPGNTYAFAVSSLDQSGREGPLSGTVYPSPVIPPDVDFREAEDFNYGGGKYPGYKGCPPAIEAPDATTIGTPQQYDYWNPGTGDPAPNEYRPANPDVRIETVEEVDDPGVFATIIGWIDVGSWYRYTFDVREAGWVKFEFRAASPGGGTLAAYWDANSNGEEELIGTVTFTTGNWHIFTWALMEEQIQTTVGIHTVRIQSVAGNLNFDKIAILWNAPPPSRWTIWEDKFDSYASDADVFSPTIGKWTRGNTTNSAGSWTLWDTAGPPLGAEPANIADMHNKYMISDSDLSGSGILLDEEIVSPEVDCTDWTKVRLNFNCNYRIYDDPDPAHTQDAEVDIRSFDADAGWSPWTNLLHLDRWSVPMGWDPPELSGSEVFDLSAYDGKKIQLKFHFFDAEYDYWFAIDKVRVSGVQLAQEIPLPIITLTPPNLTISWTAFGPGQYSVEHTSNLKGTWTKVVGPSGQTKYTAPIPADKTGYYRILGQ